MHIIIGLLTAIGSIAWALYRLQNSGVDLNSFNPFYWVRRRKWEKQMGVKPLHCLDKPINVAGVMLVGIAKLEGDITREQKTEIISIFENEFKLESRIASELYSVSSHLLQDVVDLESEIKNIFAPCNNKFQQEQKDSLLQMMQKVAELEGAISTKQSQLISTVDNEVLFQQEVKSQWG